MGRFAFPAPFSHLRPFLNSLLLSIIFSSPVRHSLCQTSQLAVTITMASRGRGRRGGFTGRGDQPRPVPTVTPAAHGGGRRVEVPTTSAPQATYSQTAISTAPSNVASLPAAHGGGRRVGVPSAAAPQATYSQTAISTASSNAASSSAPRTSETSSASVEQLGRKIEQGLSLRRPSSGLAPPRRPGYGKVGTKCIVRANHFIVQVAQKDFFQYDVGISSPVSDHICLHFPRVPCLNGKENGMDIFLFFFSDF